MDIHKDINGKVSPISFIKEKKRELKENKYRQKFDALVDDIKQNLINTQAVKTKIDQSQRTMVYWPTIRADGSTDWAVLPRLNTFELETSNVPRAAEPIEFSKILIAASAIASNAPDGQCFSTNKIKARAYYDLWKRSWIVPEMNGYSTLDATAQNLLTYGWAAWRGYPKQEIVDKTIKGKKTKKIIFDDYFREPLDPRRTWLGLSYKANNNDNRPEVLYEIDITKDEYERIKKKFNKRNKKNTFIGANASDEATAEDPLKFNTHTTLSFYENPRDNRYVIASDDIVFYDGEMPNDEIYGSVMVGQCFISDMNDPYGTGLFEMMRGNAKIYNYINSVNAEQVAAEIEPLLFVSGITGQGDLTYKRGSNKINSLPAGAKIEKINTTGNTTLGINYANAQKDDIEENTGVNNVVAGSPNGDETLGATVLQKEAALNRLIKPRNSLKQMIENDACIFFSWLEQDETNPREFIFANRDEMNDFVQANPMFHHEEGMYDENDMDEFGITNKVRVLSSQRVPVSFDYSQEGLENSNFEQQNIQEHGEAKLLLPKSKILGSIKELDQPEQIGYDKVLLKVDSNSMLVPSVELQKQTAMQLYPLIQNSLQMIYGLARQDPIQAVAQLKTFESFMKIQKQNLYDYMPKADVDEIMKGLPLEPSPQMQQEMAQQQAETGQPGAPVPIQGGNPTIPQAPNQMSPGQNPMGAAVDASMGRASKGRM